MGFIPTNKVTQQAIKGVAVTPNDAADLAIPGAVLYIGTGGDLKVTTMSAAIVPVCPVANTLLT